MAEDAVEVDRVRGNEAVGEQVEAQIHVAGSHRRSLEVCDRHENSPHYDVTYLIASERAVCAEASGILDHAHAHRRRGGRGDVI